jgi:hypothetical protein
LQDRGAAGEDTEHVDSEERLGEETEAERLKVRPLGVERGPQVAVVHHVDGAIGANVLPDQGADQRVGEQVVEFLAGGKVEMGGLMKEKLNVGVRVAEEERRDCDGEG